MTLKPPHKLFLLPIPKRLPARKVVTIAIGFTCNEGVVVCADSQATVRGYTKDYCGKIKVSLYHKHDVAMAIVGAGDEDYIQTAMNKVDRGIGEATKFTEAEEVMEKNLLDFFDANLARWAYYPRDDRPEVELLIGINFTKGPCGLFHYCGTAFRRIVGMKAIGTGSLLAGNFLSIWKLDTLEQLGSAAAYILYKVKKNVDSCGGFSDIVVLKKGGKLAMVDSREIEKLESKFAEIDLKNEERLRGEVAQSKLPPYWYFGERKPEEK